MRSGGTMRGWHGNFSGRTGGSGISKLSRARRRRWSTRSVSVLWCWFNLCARTKVFSWLADTRCRVNTYSFLAALAGLGGTVTHYRSKESVYSRDTGLDPVLHPRGEYVSRSKTRSGHCHPESRQLLRQFRFLASGPPHAVLTGLPLR